LTPLAVDEMLRFAGPINQFLRTATKDCDLSGKAIKAGDPLVLLYVSANRDERIWDDPDRFDVARVPQPGHLAFGWGEHVCPGASLARLSVTVFFEELFKRFSGWEIAGPIDRRPATTINSIDSLPVRLTARL
jgi:cytochrome P450